MQQVAVAPIKHRLVLLQTAVIRPLKLPKVMIHPLKLPTAMIHPVKLPAEMIRLVKLQTGILRPATNYIIKVVKSLLDLNRLFISYLNDF